MFGSQKVYLTKFLEALLGALGGSSSPTLRDVLDNLKDSEKSYVNSSASVLEATSVMVEHHASAVMVLEEGQTIGILTTKDILTRVVAKGLNCAFTCVSNVMTPDPDSAVPNSTILNALHTMHGRIIQQNFKNTNCLLFDRWEVPTYSCRRHKQISWNR